MTRPPVDWNDLEAIRRVLLDLRVALDDMNSVVEDMLRKPRQRSLGHVQHKELYGDGRKSAVELLDYLTPPPH